MFWIRSISANVKEYVLRQIMNDQINGNFKSWCFHFKRHFLKCWMIGSCISVFTKLYLRGGRCQYYSSTNISCVSILCGSISNESVWELPEDVFKFGIKILKEFVCMVCQCIKNVHLKNIGCSLFHDNVQ